MGFLRTAGLTALTLLALCATAGAAVLVNFTHENVYGPSVTNMNVTDIAIDNANRTWFSTTLGGLMVLEGQAKLPRFPIISDLFSDALSTVEFADATSSGETQEHFFIGSNIFDASIRATTGLQYGRLLESGLLSFGNDQCTDDPGYEGNLTCALNDTHPDEPGISVVNDLNIDPLGNVLWVASEEGVTFFTLPNLEPSDELVDADYDTPRARSVVAADPTLSGGVAFFVSQVGGVGEVHMVVDNGTALGARTFDALGALEKPVNVAAIDVDASGNLWVAEVAPNRDEQRIYRYVASDLRDWALDPLLQPVPMPSPYLFDPNRVDPSLGSSAPLGGNLLPNDRRRINAIEINDGTGEIWLATDLGAYFQEFSGSINPKVCSPGIDWDDTDAGGNPVLDDADNEGTLCYGPGAGWRPMLQKDTETERATRENFGALRSDAGANMWLGSDAGFRAVIARLMTISGTRFVGEGSTVAVNLTDITIADGDPVSVDVDVGGTVATLPLTGASGNYSVTFGFTFGSESLTDPPYRFSVEPTSAGIPITVTYNFTDALGNPSSLVATASWAQIVEFEDDFLIGGPCMIKAAGR